MTDTSSTVKQNEWILNPYLHFEPGRIYNPLTDVQIHRGEDWDLLLRGLFAGQYIIAEMPSDVRQILYQQGWLVQAEQAALAQQFYLKYVSLEASDDFICRKCIFARIP